MRFFSKKTRGDKKITIFTALLNTVWRFINSFTQLDYYSTQKQGVLYKNLPKLHVVFVLLLLVVIGGVGAKTALSQIDVSSYNLSVKSTLLVYPASVGNTTWSGTEHVLTPDLDEESIYQDFSARNSAYVPLKTLIIDDVEITKPAVVEDIDEGTSSSQGGSEEIQIEQENNSIDDQTVPTRDIEDSSRNTNTVETESIVPSDVVNEDESNVESPDQQSAPSSIVPDSQESQPVTLKKANLSFFTFFRTVTELFPFAQESEVITVEESTQTTSLEATPSLNSDTLTVENGTTTTSTITTEDTASSVVDQQVESDVDTNKTEPELPKNFVTRTLSLSDFSTPDLKPGDFVTGLQLRMSLAALYKKQDADVTPLIEINYRTPSSTELVGTIIVDEEVSNALNGGYFLFALPETQDVSALTDVSIDITYKGPIENLDGLYLDAVWLEIDVEKIDKELLEAKVSADTQERLEDPKIHELLSEDVDFVSQELPHFSLRYLSQRNIAVKLLRNLLGRPLAEVAEVSFVHNDAGDIGVMPQIDVTEDGLLTIQLNEYDRERLKPGEYTVELVINEGGVSYNDSFSFQWGLLSINPNKTSNKVGEPVQISAGSLSPNGNTVCDAQLQLFIIDPSDVVSKVPVTPSGVCNGNNVTDVPDYGASFIPLSVGEYEMYLERIDVDGKILSHTSDTFLVAETLPLSIERNGPSRIYPRATYPMELTVHSDAMWSGTLIEEVPADFVISSTSAIIVQKGDIQELRFEVAIDTGGSQSFTYSFDAPDISPYLYTLGSARLEGEIPMVSEVTPSSATTTSSQSEEVPDTQTKEEKNGPDEILLPEESLPDSQVRVTPGDTESILTEEIDLKEEPSQPQEETILEKIIDALPFFSTTEDEASVIGDDTLIEVEVLQEPAPMEQMHAGVIESVEAVASASVSTSSVQETAEETSKGVVFEEHRQWQIASDATGSMIAYWTSGASVPVGWTCLSCGSGTFYQRFVRGAATYNSSGGSATHTHTASGTVNASSVANSENRAGVNVALNSHSHTYTPTITASTTLPAYRNLRVIQNNSAGEPATVPAGVVMLFDGTLPSGWAQYTALNNRYPRGENTIASLGTSTHRHTISGSTQAAAGSTVDGRNGGTQVNASTEDHTHTVTSNTGFINHEPPFITVRFATSSVATNTPTSAITMWTDTPPAQWQNVSAQASDPFFDKFIKGSATYGTTGGTETHTHNNVTGITSSAAVGTQNARTGATGANTTHTHAVDVTNFTTANHLPPYVTAIFGKKYGPIPLYTQSGFKFYANTNASTPTDAWPVGGDALLENEVIDETTVPVKNADVVRIRTQLSVSNSTSTAESFKLQFASTTALCTDITTWTDVGNATSSTKWRGYNNAGVADGATLSSSTISGTDVYGSYEETNPSVTMPNTVGIGQQGEWDFVVQQNGALAGTIYCFRMVESDNTPLFAYAQYPSVVTNEAPDAPLLSKLFDNEKVATTTPDFEFSASDGESNDLTYQIQVDDDALFGSVTIDRNSLTHSTQFENLATPADKDPFTQGKTIRFNNTTALTNGTTYYWRVRASDPTGSNTQGSWSTVRSFTVDTSLTFSTWFQTTDEQFDTNTLSGVDGVTDQAQLRVGSTTGTMYSDPITFSEGTVGTAWGSFAFADTETSSDLKYTIQYNNGGTWTDIPDSVLAGNVAGHDTSPVSLLGVNKTTYSEIRIEANFVNSGASPSLQDWTVTWGYLIETPTISAPFGNEKVSTTTPTFEFTTTDPQNDSLQYQIQWSTTYAFTASTTRNSNVNAGFSNVTNGGDLDPFNSGDTIRFKIQSADALVNGTTYWWRVRARDPLGSNAYSFFTDPRSVTVDTAVTVSTWFQTTQSQFANDTLSNAFARATNVITVATTTQSSLIAYAEGTVTTPRYRTWDGSVWSAESSALDVGATINWTVTKASPIESEYVLATLGTDADVNVQVFRSGAWGNLQEVTASISNTNMRGFDVAYEQSSGDAMVVTCDGDANPSYWIWNGSTWTNGGAVGLSAGNTCGWIKLISDPTSDEIIAITRDTTGTGYESRVWDGSAWGNSATWGSMSQTNHEGIAAAYEDSGGQAVVAVSNGTASSFSWRAWTGASWGAAAAAVTIGDDFESGTMAADDGTDNLALCYIDEDGDIGVMRWTGAGWNAFVAASDEIETTWTTLSGLYNDQPIDCAFEIGGSRDGYIMAVYSDRTNTRYRSFTGALPWTAEASVSTLGVGPRVQLRRTGANRIQTMLYSTSTDSYNYADWNGTTWSSPLQTLETNGSVGATPFKVPFMIDPANPSVTGSVIGTPIASFYEGSGPYWQQLSWVDTTTGGSDILYQVEYYDGDSWELIPNNLIPGNSTGTTTSPINLTNVLPASTYDEIRPVANMSCNLGTCPSLSDWTITWAAGITISGTADAYDQTTDVTSGTVAVALNGTEQIGKTGTISGGTWSIANVNAAPGDIVSVFVTGAATSSEAVAVTKYDGVGNITGMNLYQRHLSIGSDDLATITNANLGLYDFTNTEDIFYNIDATNDLSICTTPTGCTDAEVIIKAGNMYQPGSGADISTHDFENNGTLRLNGNTMRLTGSWDNNATTSLATSTVWFTATSTSETLDETGAISPSFNTLRFGLSTSTATWTLGSTLDVNGTLTISGGTFARNSRAITLAGNLSNAQNGVWTGIGTTTFDGATGANWTDASVALQNIGRVVIDGTTKTVTLGDDAKAQSLTIGGDDTFDASSSDFDVTVFRNWINNNTFNARNGTVFFVATTTGRIITAGGDNFYDMTFSGVGGAWSFTENTLGVNNDFSITGAGTVTLPTATTTIVGSFINSAGTFVHNNGQLYFTSPVAETLTLGGTAFTNAFYNVRFTGNGSWSFTEANATTSNLFRITQGNVVLPSNTLTIGDTFTNSAGTFSHNNGTVKFRNTGTKVIDTNASFNSLLFVGAGSNFSFLDSSVTALGNLTVSAGTLALPTGTLTLGGSLTNSATLTHNSGTVLFNSTDAGEIVNLGSSSLYNMTFNSATGGWTISENATSTNNTTLTASRSFTLASGKKLSVGSVFTNSVGGASTTWSGSTLSLEAGAYSLNTKANTGDAYATVRVDTNTDIKMWNSTSTVYTVDATGSLYSQDHNGVDGDLYIFGNYPRSSGTEYWSSATDFDGTALGGSSRQVDVRFASGASASFTDSIVQIQGSSTATTTIANQGAGNYTVSLSGGTTTARYYSFANLGATGVSLGGTNHVTSLANGVFNAGVGGGTGLTISSTTIDTNPGLQIFNVSFGTSSPVVANNVKQIDAAPVSYWWFRNSAGTLDGEAFDLDTGDPGSIRWDNSSLSFTVSGTVYSDDGSTPLVGGTCNGVATPVRVVVEGGATYNGTCSAVNGSFSIPGVIAVGDPTVTVYLNGASGGEKAVTVTKTPTANITGLDLYVNRVIVRHEDTAPLSIEDMASYDSTDDSDIFFRAATGTIDSLITFANTELFVWATTTFAPGGTVQLNANATGNSYDGSLHIDNGATFVASSSATTTIGGSFILDTNATFTHATGTVVMNATTSGKAISIASGEVGAFNLLRFTGASGGWNLSGSISASDDIQVANGTVTGTPNITIPNGSLYGNGILSFGSGTTTIQRSNTLGGTQPWTLANLVLGNGSTVGTTTPGSTATTTINGRLTLQTGHYLDAGSSHFNFSGSGTVFVENGTFLQDTSTVRYSGVSGANILSTTYYNLSLNASAGTPTYTAVGLGIAVSNNLTVGGIGNTTVNFTTNNTPLDVNGNVTIASNGTFIASNSGIFTVGGSWDNNGIFTHSSGSITFDGAGTVSISAGTSWFNNATINGAGTFTVTEHATSSGAFSLSSAGSFTLSSGQTLAVGGVFTNGIGGGSTTWTGSTLRLYSATNYQINAKTIADAYETISVAGNTDIRMWNSSAVTYTVDATGSLYSQDHNDITGDLYIYGNYPGNGATDVWSYATDFDGTSLGGGSRQVDVRFASGASMVLQNGGLQVLGTASASTSIQNQGSGTYGMRIGGTASTSWSYYDIEDQNSSGLTFSGTPNIVSLSYGDIEVTQGGGTAITVGGNVITTNPAKTFTNNIFATTTVISAFNVTATGTSVSSWRFTNHSGNIDGESKDVDPDGNPGYIAWDDSASTITVSGNVYSDEGVTVSGVCDGSTNNVHLRVAGLTSYTTNCNASTGLYSISGVNYSIGNSLVVYIDGETEKGATVTEDPISNIGSLHIYENRVIARHEGTDSLSIADMAVWDSSDDADIPFTAVDAGTDTLTLPANRKLLVWTTKEFEPNGNVTLSGGGGGAVYDGTFEAQTNAIVTFSGTQAHSVGGSFILGNGVTFDAGLSTTTFTTSGSARTIDINNEGFYNVAFTGSGSWTITDATFDVNNAFITNGTLTLPTGTTTVASSWSNNGGAFVINGSTMVFTAVSGGKVVRGGGSNFEELIFNGSGGSWSMTDTNATATAQVIVTQGTVSLPSGIFSVGGSFRNNGGTITHNTSELILRSGSPAVLKANGSDLYGVTISGTGPFVMSDANLTLRDDFRMTQGSITLATSTLSVGGSFVVTGGTFAHASGTVLFNASATGKTVNPRLSPFYNVVFGSGTGGWTVSANATTTNNFTLSTASSFTQQTGTRLYVGNVFTNSVGGSATTWTGSTLVLDSESEYAINTKTTGGDNYQTLIIGNNSDIEAWNSQATTTTVARTSSLYSQDHATVNGALYIFGDYHISTTTEYWSYATDFDGTALGGSPRAVTVSIIANATTTLDGGSLNIVGTVGNETTITNQGSGTYDFNVSDGTFNALYYEFRNLNSNGLTLTSAPTISSLSYGDFELAVNGGNLITLSSSTLNANASMVITGNRFATTTVITGTNVALIGTTTNVWTFVAHTGNLDGEAYDSDGVTACGSLRWSDSSCLLTQQTHYRWRNDDGGTGVPNTEWFNGSWNNRISVRLENPDATTYTNAVVKLDVAFDSDMQSDFDDLRFTDASGTTTIPHFIERYTASTEADVWVKVPSLLAGETTTLFMYFNNGSASSTGSSTRTFIVADDFEDGNISEYSGDTSLFTVDGTFAYGGSYGLDATGNESSRATDGIGRTSMTVTQGQILRYMQYVDTTAGSGDEVCTLFGVQSPVTANQNYAVCLEQFGVDRMSLAKDVDDTDTSGVVLSSTTVSYVTGWHEVEIDWKTDDSMFVTLSRNGSVVATTSDTDATYTTGGIGFTFWFQNGGWDNYTARPYVATEPTVRFGAKQVDGGASWKEDINTGATFAINDVARVRFAVENTGLQITNQTFDIEFAQKGVAPSCEAVSSGSYTQIPPLSSCGSSALCMASSTHITNGASVADLLVGPEIDFTLGEVVEDPSNTSDALTLDQNEYTELEYAIRPTFNVSGSSYCLRVTDDGDPVDTYLSVAEMLLRFDPVVANVSINGGADISLIEGATTTVYATGTVSDQNGYTDLVSATSTMYRSGAGPACTADTNNCYISGGAPSCTFSLCAGNSCTVSCQADFYYHADATDIAPFIGENWLASIEVSDQLGSIDIGTVPQGVEVFSLPALDVTSAISYGSLSPASTTGSYNPTTTVRNLGNIPIDIDVEGSDLTDGISSLIPAYEQIFGTSTFTYTSCVTCQTLSSTSLTSLELDLLKPTSTSTAVTDIVYWGIEIPAVGIAGRPHSGTNIFYAVGD